MVRGTMVLRSGSPLFAGPKAGPKKLSKNGETIVLRKGSRSKPLYLRVQKMFQNCFKNGQKIVRQSFCAVGRVPSCSICWSRKWSNELSKKCLKMMRRSFCAVGRSRYYLIYLLVKKWCEKIVEKLFKNSETTVLRYGSCSYLIYLLVQKMVQKIVQQWSKNAEAMVKTSGIQS
jgi:hypothetical protein